MFLRIVRALASLKLTLVLLAVAMVLIFAGTLAQATQGIGPTIEGYFRSAIAWIDLQLFVPRQLARVPFHLPFPGGGLICGLLIVNLLAAHLSRFKLTARRVGVTVLHAGLILLFAGEFVTGWFSREGTMTIDEGGRSNYIEDTREVELAIVDVTGDARQRVVAIAQRRLAQAGATVSSEALPFEVRVERWMSNARLERSESGSIATQGIGRQVSATPLPPVSGVETNMVDAPTAFISLHRGPESMGVWLISLNLAAPQRVTVNGRTFELSLRFKRTYKPYTLELIDFRHDKFVGTEVARNFSSRVRLSDPAHGTDREVLISMNHPLRYAGETFYQSSFKPDDSGTILMVVRNPGWLIPYIACALVCAGMVYHFLYALWGFLRKRRSVRAEGVADELRPRAPWTAALPWAGAATALIIVAIPLMSGGKASSYDIGTFARIPVSADGRVKPFDTVARNALMAASGRQSIRTANGTVDASTFLLDLMARPDVAKDYPVIRVDHPDVLALLDRTADEAGRLTMAQIEPHWNKVLEQVKSASQVPPRQRDPFQRSVLELFERVTMLLNLSSMRAPYAIPPLRDGESWRPFHTAFVEARNAPDGTQPNPAIGHVIAVMTAYHEQQNTRFNQAVYAYQALVGKAFPHDAFKSNVEVWFNRMGLFQTTTAVYVLALVLASMSLLMRVSGGAGQGKADALRSAVVGMLLADFVVHTIAIALRIYLQGRPPVTNLYSSAVFIGWACVGMALVFEKLFPLGLSALCASAIGAGTLIVAHNLGNDGDTMQMMQAVLDSNFWLATHVITVTLGYATTFFAGFLGIVYVLLGVFTRFLNTPRAKAIGKMIYGVVCFALLFSFVGTVLGGIWADQSWGRFWGWDPKENGAALVVLINAIILHARWGGLVRERGIAFLAIAGNIVTAWSWFGTNMLGVGLHSYGFMESAAFWLLAFVASQLLLIAFALLPERTWRNHGLP
ncbi:MAG: cytochrome c biogenesis protein CcsA [Tepidisphaeraceae bacterium]